MSASTDINELRAKLVEARKDLVEAVGSDNLTGKKIEGFTIPDATRINSMTSERTIQKHINRIKRETDRLNNLKVDKLTVDMGTASSPSKVEEPDSDDDEFHDPQVDIQQIVIPPRFSQQQPQQQPQQNLVLYQDPALLNHFQRIERSTLIDLNRDLRNAGIDDETIRNLSMDEKQEYAKLIRELNYGGPSKLVGSAPNPKFKDLLDNRYTDQYIYLILTRLRY